MPHQTAELYIRYPRLQAIEVNISTAFSVLKETVQRGGKIFACGNGGSASDAGHMVGELMKSFILPRPIGKDFRSQLERLYGACESERIASGLQSGIRSIALVGDPAFVTAFSNDCSYEMLYAQQVFVLGDPGDCLVSFSCSGNSPNILNAMMVAKAKGIKTILFTTAVGGKAAPHADALINVPETETYKAQELHLPIYHALCAALEEEIYGAC